MRKYDREVEYTSGAEIPVTDHLSRSVPKDYHEVTIELIYYIDCTLPARAENLTEIAEKTDVDPTLSLLRKAVFTRWPRKINNWQSLTRDYLLYREEIVCEEGILIKGDRIIIQTVLLKDILDKSKRTFRNS